MTETMTQAEHDRLEREYFRSVDRFFLLNQDAFVQAFEKLKSMVSVGFNLAQILALYVRAVASGEFTERSVLQTMPRICAIPLMSVYLHLAFDAPLYLDEALLLGWAFGDGTPAQCLSCGLRVPKSADAEKCPHCSGTIGPAGEWDRQRAIAVVN